MEQLPSLTLVLLQRLWWREQERRLHKACRVATSIFLLATRQLLMRLSYAWDLLAARLSIGHSERETGCPWQFERLKANSAAKAVVTPGKSLEHCLPHFEHIWHVCLKRTARRVASEPVEYSHGEAERMGRPSPVRSVANPEETRVSAKSNESGRRVAEQTRVVLYNFLLLPFVHSRQAWCLLQLYLVCFATSSLDDLELQLAARRLTCSSLTRRKSTLAFSVFAACGCGRTCALHRDACTSLT